LRFLHTADWHIGKPLRGRSRMDEFAAALDEVHRIAASSQIDAVLLAGDVFDSPAPPPEAEKLVYDFFARLIPERIACVVIAGNHDHPRKLAALASLLEGLQIHIRAEVRPPGQGGVVAVPSRDGKEQARIAVLPFVPERKVVDACAVMGPEHGWYEAYARRLEQILHFLTRELTPETVNLLVGHLLVSGARFGTGERQLHLGDIYGVNAEQLPGNVQYVALGHLHRPQELLAPAKTCYSGSLIELDFGEREQDKRVVLIDAKPGRAVTLESAPLSAGRRLRDVVGTLAELQGLTSEVGTDFLRVTVKAEAPTPGLADVVRELLPNALEVSVDYPRQTKGPSPQIAGHHTLQPAELFARYYQTKNGAEPGADLARLFDEVYEEAHD
jgi:DNA repair protein SbcD/Mre11